MADHVQINALERALSEDINDLQSMSSRLLNDFLANLGALRLVMNSGALFDTVPQSVVMGLDVRGAGANLTVGAGFLSQFSATWPAAPAALESAQRLGITRVNTSVAVPATLNTWMILEARVVDVDTLVTNRDVFDVPTQTFIPTVVTKQVERQIEFQIVQGTTTQLPVFTGDPWVPILGFVTDGAGQVPSLPGTLQLDFRNNLKDLLGDIPVRGAVSSDAPEAVVESWAIHGHDPGAAAIVIGGNFMGRIGGGRVWLKAGSGINAASDVTVTGAANSAEHIYLCPLIANGVTIYPVLTSGILDTSSKGQLMRSALGPAEEGPDNASVLSWGAGLYNAFDSIPINKAVYVTQLYVGRGGFGVDGYVQFTSSSGGRILFRSDRTAPTNAMVRVVDRALGAIAAPELQNFDLSGTIPNNARTAILQLFVRIAPGAATSTLSWAFTRQGSPFVYGNFGQLSLDSATDVDSAAVIVEVPVHETGGAGAGRLWALDLRPTGSTPFDVEAEVDVLGWTF